MNLKLKITNIGTKILKFIVIISQFPSHLLVQAWTEKKNNSATNI
jgi:hypothetical protein